jgi:hypothetical protein
MWMMAFGERRMTPEIWGGQGKRQREEEGRFGMDAMRG